MLATLPILYSFRRCPYAMRARLALHVSGIAVELREVALSNKPAALLAASPKATVPVLVLPDEKVIDESWDIMLWALSKQYPQHDPENWLGEKKANVKAASELINENDTHFKHNLDRYKYPDLYPEQTQIYYRTQGALFLQQLEHHLSIAPNKAYLLGDSLSIADAGIFPFIRQFADVDKNWFELSPYPLLQAWLKNILDTERYAAVMKKYPPWKVGDAPVVLRSDASH